MYDLQIWSTNDGSLLAEWKQPDGEPVVSYSCLACGFVGKKVASNSWKRPQSSVIDSFEIHLNNVIILLLLLKL